MTQKDMKISWVPQGGQATKVQTLAPTTEPQGSASSPTWMVGCGNMGGAVLAGMARRRRRPGSANDHPPERHARRGRSGREAATRMRADTEAGDPRGQAAVSSRMSRALRQPPDRVRTVIVSMLAGVTSPACAEASPRLRPLFGSPEPTGGGPARGHRPLWGRVSTSDAKARSGELFAQLGYTIWTEQRSKLAALGALGGAGPAYVARFVRRARQGRCGAQGLSSATAATIALETVFGTAWLAASSGDTMDALGNPVASPNGTTEAGLAVMDREDVLDQLVARHHRGGSTARRGARGGSRRPLSLRNDCRVCPRRRSLGRALDDRRNTRRCTRRASPSSPARNRSLPRSAPSCRRPRFRPRVHRSHGDHRI